MEAAPINALRLQLVLLFHRYGWLPALALGLALAAGWLHFAVLSDLEAKAEGLQATVAALEAKARAAAGGRGAAVPLIEQRYAAFRDRLVAKEAVPDIIRTLFAEARESGLTVQEMDYQLKREEGEAYAVYRIDAPIKGPYPRIHQFAENVLVKVPAAALEDISFRRDGVNASSTEAKLRFAIYLRRED